MEDGAPKMSLLYQIAICYDFGSIDSALYYCELAAQLSQQEENDRWICRSNSKLTILYARSGRYQDAEVSVQKCANSCKTDLEFSKVYNNNAIYYGISNQPLKAIDALTKSLTINTKMGNADGQAKSLMNLAANYENLSDHERALDYLTQALTINDSLGKEVNLAINYGMLSMVYEAINDNDKALHMLDQSIEITSRLDMQQRLAFAYFNKGKVLKKLRRKEEAIQHYLNSKVILEEIGDELSLVPVIDALAQLYMEEGKLEKALRLTDNNILRAEQTNDRRNYVINLVTRGRIHLERRQFQSAYDDAFRSLAFAEDNAVLEEKLQSYELLVRLDSITGNYQQGVRHLREMASLKDSLISIAEVEKIAELNTRLETKDKEKEISLLAKDNELKATQLAQQKRNITIGFLFAALLLGLAIYLSMQRRILRQTKGDLETSLAEKETLLKEIHHRVKNNLQLITSLLNLQADSDDSQSIEDFLYKGQNRVKSMALIHEQLYQSVNISSINMEEYIQQLVQSILQSFGMKGETIQLQIKADSIQLDIDQAIPLGLIINELVNNSLKHAFEEQVNGQLSVSLEQQEDQVLLTVSDNGRGIEINSQSSDTLGIQLVQLLTKQLQCKLRFITEQGTAAIISFQTPQYT